MRSPGRAFHAARILAATIIVTTALIMMLRRPMRAAMELTLRNMMIVPPRSSSVGLDVGEALAPGFASR